MDVLLVSLTPKFHSVLLYDQPFSRYHTVYNSPLSTMLNSPKRTHTHTHKTPKIQSFKFRNSLTTLVETLPGGGGVCMNFWEQIRCILSICRLKLSLPYGPMLTKTKKKKNGKSTKFEFSQFSKQLW